MCNIYSILSRDKYVKRLKISFTNLTRRSFRIIILIAAVLFSFVSFCFINLRRRLLITKFESTAPMIKDIGDTRNVYAVRCFYDCSGKLLSKINLTADLNEEKSSNKRVSFIFYFWNGGGAIFILLLQ